MRILSLVAVIALLANFALGRAEPPGNNQEIDAYAPINATSGWLLTTDRLYLTRNAGMSWDSVTPDRLPGEILLSADFVAEGYGWAVLGRPAGDEQASLRLAQTVDWGTSWTAADLTLFAPGDPDPTITRAELDFTSLRDGTLHIQHASSSNFERWSEWRTADGGRTWRRLTEATAMAQEREALTGDRFANHRDGWRLERTGSCDGSGATRTCRQVVTLQATTDGGATWHPMALPPDLAGERSWTTGEGPGLASAAVTGSRTMIAWGQGFDKCEVATADQLWDWRWSSPYSAVNLYIGGSMRACSNRALSADYLRTISDMGWSFIPTWVGPQSPCYTGSKGVMSRDPVTAQGEGWSEAMAAADTVARLGLTEPDGTGSIVYYDIEYYNTSDGVCNAAVQAFVTGWVQGLHARGNTAGVYGTGSTLRLLPNLNPPPDAIWAAHWIFSSYNPEATVWNVYTLSNDLWVNHQRLRQYTGGHWETWGSTALNIDSNVLDGIVAAMNPPPSPAPTPTATPTRVPFTPTAWQYLPMVFY